MRIDSPGWAVAAFLLLVMTACGSSTAAVQTVGADDAARLIEDSRTVLLDIRTPEEFADARIEGAVNIDFYADDFADRIASLDRDVTYVVYCRSGNRSASARDTFEDLGFDHVNELEGGILTWVQAGLPTVSG